MSRVEQIIDIELYEGMDQKTADKMLPLGRLAEVENGLYNKNGELSRMLGLSSFGDTHSLGENINNVDSVFKYRGRTVIDGSFQDDLGSATTPRYSRGFGNVNRTANTVTFEDQNIGPLSGVSVETLDGTDVTNARSVSVSVLNGYTMKAWARDSGGTNDLTTVSVIRDSDETEVFRDTVEGNKPRTTHVNSANGHLVVVYADSTNLDAIYFDTSDESTGSYNVTTVKTNWDISPRDGEDVFDVYYTTGPTSIDHIRRSATGTFIGTGVVVTENLNTAQIQIAQHGTTTNRYALCWVRDTAGSFDPRFAEIATSGTAAPTVNAGPHSLAAIAATPTINAVYGAGLHGNQYAFFVNRDVNGATPEHIETYHVDSSNTTRGSPVDLYHAQCICKPVHVEGTSYFAICSSQQAQAIGHIVAFTEFSPLSGQGCVSVVGNFLVGSANPGQSTSNPALRDREILFPAVRQASIVAGASGAISILNQPALVTAAVSGESRNYVTIGSNVYRPGGFTAVFDGQYKPMIGAFEPPDDYTTTVLTTGGNIGSGTYKIRLVAEYTDTDGRRWQSRPSTAKSVTVASGTTNRIQLSDVYVTSGYVAGFPEGLPVTIRVYRTLDGANEYYDTGLTMPWRIGGSFTHPLTAVILTEDDGTIDGNPLLYTEGALANDPPPPSRDLAFANGRLWLVSSDSEDEIWVSKTIVEGQGVHFSIALKLITSGQGQIQAIEEMDGNLVIFRRESIYVVVAQAPSDSGTGSFGSPRLVTGEVGCVSTGSVVKTDAGILFQSDRGIYLVSRSLQVAPIGVQVEDYSFGDWSVRRGRVKKDTHEVWFLSRNATLSGFRFLVWNTLYKRWSTSKLYTDEPWKASDFEFFGGIRIVTADQSTSTDRLLKETSGDFTGTQISIKTPWIALGKNGARTALYLAKRLVFFGTWLNPTSVSMDVFFDWEQSSGQSINFAASGGYTSDDVLEFQAHLSRQRVQAIKITITDGTTGSLEGFRPSKLSLVYTPLISGVKLPDSLSV